VVCYIAISVEHYCLRRVYCSATEQERIVDTIEFMPQHCKVPGLSSVDTATIVASTLTHALFHPSPVTLFKQPGPKKMHTIKELSAIFDKMAPQHAPTLRVLDPHSRTGQAHHQGCQPRGQPSQSPLQLSRTCRDPVHASVNPHSSHRRSGYTVPSPGNTTPAHRNSAGRHRRTHRPTT
jgi:hypothetical protein